MHMATFRTRKALGIAVKLVIEPFAKLQNEEQFQRILGEHGGMNEVLAEDLRTHRQRKVFTTFRVGFPSQSGA